MSCFNSASPKTGPWHETAPTDHDRFGWSWVAAAARACSGNADPTGPRCVCAYHWPGPIQPSPTFTLGELLQNQVKPGDVLVSFNYDTLVERLALRFGYSLRPYCDEFRTDVMTFVKPHGSVSCWCLDLNERSVTYMGPSGSLLINALNEHDVEKRREPFLLGAVPIKSELIEEVQRHYGVSDVFSVVMRQWKAVREAVAKAERLIVVGYSFPSEDQYGTFLFREGMRSRDCAPTIAYYETPNRASERAARIMATFQCKETHLTWMGEVNAP